MASQAAPLEIKVCIIGDTDVGKTCLSMRYCHGNFPENSTPTIGASFLQRRILCGETEVSLQIWDTAGQERFRSMAPMYYRGAKAAIMVFDVTNEESYHRVTTWLRDLKAHADPDLVLCLVASKCDMPAKFDISICEEYAATLGAPFIKTSAVTGEGVDDVFETISQRVVEVCRKQKRNLSNDLAGLSLGAANQRNHDMARGSCC